MNSKWTVPQLIILGVVGGGVFAFMTNQLSVHYLWPVSYSIGAVVGVLSGLAALFLYNLLRKPK